MATVLSLDPESCYRAVKSRDRRFDGVFFTAVRTTRIYCRPSCPARTPSYANVTFHPTAAAAQGAGYRACKRCLPDATPGSPDWDIAADTAGRAMRLISDGVVDRDGVEGLATQVGYTSRHLVRVLTTELGAGPLALARARRAQTARILIETTELSYADVAFAAGFASVRQFNETVREVYAASPSELRGRRAGSRPTPGTLRLRLAVRTPFAGRALLGFLAARSIDGVEVCDEQSYARTLALPHGPGEVRVCLADAPAVGDTAFMQATFVLTDVRDTSAAVERVRRLLDADCDPLAIADEFGGDAVLGAVARRLPGLRVPGQVDGAEVAVRAVVGQQVSVAGARTVLGRLVREHGEPGEFSTPGLTHVFPTTQALATLSPEAFPMPRARGRALIGLNAALAQGRVLLNRGADRGDVRRKLLDLPGIGPWTADYIALRALGDPDVFLPSDLGTRAALTRLGQDPRAAEMLSQHWRPWRSYAQVHLWQSLLDTDVSRPADVRRES